MTKKIIKINDLEIILERKKNVKNIYLRVMQPGGEVKITAPIKITQKFIEKFVLSHINEIKEKIDKAKSYPKIEYISGEKHYLWGKEHILILKDSNKNKAYINNGNLILETNELDNFDKKEKIINEFYRDEMKKFLPGIIEEKCKITNLTINEYRIKNMKTKWGTCNVTDRRIWINLQLAKREMICLEYIVVHELIHLLELNHTKRFHQLVERYFENVEEAELELNKKIF